jgi:hypothetical protein
MRISAASLDGRHLWLDDYRAFSLTPGFSPVLRRCPQYASHFNGFISRGYTGLKAGVNENLGNVA